LGTRETHAESDERAALLAALRGVVEPLALLAVQRGVPYAAVDELMRRAFVGAADAAHPDMLAHRKVSRLSTATGINRREVARLLGVLRDRTPTMNELARLLDLDKSSVTGLVDRAQRRGLVVRVPSTADRRAVLVRLTDAGRSLVSGGAARFEADISQLLELLPPPDREALSGLISRLLIAHAADRGIDLFATISTDGPEPGSPPATRH